MKFLCSDKFYSLSSCSLLSLTKKTLILVVLALAKCNCELQALVRAVDFCEELALISLTVHFKATSLTKQFSLYISPHLDTQTVAVDAMLQDWSNMDLYIFLPFATIQKVVNKFRKSELQNDPGSSLVTTKGVVPRSSKFSGRRTKTSATQTRPSVPAYGKDSAPKPPHASTDLLETFHNLARFRTSNKVSKLIY